MEKIMQKKPDILAKLYPGSKTTLMQHLQMLVVHGNPYWIGGVIAPHKLEALVLKLAGRYPIHREEVGRTYDRSKGKAGVHLVVYPTPEGVAWWVLSSDGPGGLHDKASADYHVAKHAMERKGHITFGDYVMLYAHKKDARTVLDTKTGKEKQIVKDCSTWTWKCSDECVAAMRAMVRKEVELYAYGADTPEKMWGVKGYLAFQRRRPLFSGVRAQVLELHRYAADEWTPRRKGWLKKHPDMEAKGFTGELRTIKNITENHLPKMGRFKVFTDQTRTVGSLVPVKVAETEEVAA
jgi:hypothetical protein